MIRVALPYHLRTMAGLGSEVELDVPGTVTADAILDALEARFPMLAGTIREHGTGQRRAYLRFFGCGEDLSHDPQDRPLSQAIVAGEEPFIILGAISGG